MTGPRALRSPCPDCYIGIDLGTSGVRACAIDAERRLAGGGAHRSALAATGRRRHSEQDPQLWWQGVVQVLQELEERLQDYEIRALAVDGTSATLLLTDPAGVPLTPALMYDDSRSRAMLAQLAEAAPADSPVHSASSSLAKLLYLKDRLPQQPFLALHQADWILGKLSGRFGVSDENNCLKLGYDPPSNGAGRPGSPVSTCRRPVCPRSIRRAPWWAD